MMGVVKSIPTFSETWLPTHDTREHGYIRVMTSLDLDDFLNHFLDLDQESRRCRFGMDVNDRWLTDYVARTNLANTTILGFYDRGLLAGVAELRSFSSEWSMAAEAAFSVETQSRGQGIGTRLMDQLLMIAGTLKISTVHLICSIRNRPMICVAERVATKVHRDSGDYIAEICVS